MPQPSTQEEFVHKAKILHRDKYDYSSVVYTNCGTKVRIMCRTCNFLFEQTPDVHLRGCGCPTCGRKKAASSRKMSRETFVEKANKIHGQYGYELVTEDNFTSTKKNIPIVCKEHGVFLQSANSHLAGRGCPMCGSKRTGDKNRRTLDDFIKKGNNVHKNKYSYSKTVYIDNCNKVCITCPTHGDFWQIPANHLSGAGCPRCKAEKISELRKKDTSTFIEEAKKVHGENTYDYSLVDYKGKAIKVKIICPIHGVFTQTPNSHLCGTGCPHCSSSKGEKRIAKFLETLGIKFKSHFKIKFLDSCGKIRKCEIDFFLPEQNFFIEYNGGQHYFPVEHFGGEEKLKKQKERDECLRVYCKEKDINLIEIPYTEYDNIEIILRKYLKL